MAGAFTEKYKDFLPYGSEDVWIETGTYYGNSVAKALEFGFKEIHTTEVCQRTFQELEVKKPWLCNDARVHRYLGSSRELLLPIIEQVKDRDVVIWLDAHYQGESQDERDAISECPILEELQTIACAAWRQAVVVCIDDSNLFTDIYWECGLNREKFTAADWPRESQMMTIMQGWHSHNEDHILYFYHA